MLHVEAADVELTRDLKRHGLAPPMTMPSSVTSGDKEVYLLDRNKQNLYSEFIRRSRMQLPGFV